MLNTRDFQFDELHIIKKCDGKYTLSVSGEYKGEHCNIEVLEINKPSFNIRLDNSKVYRDCAVTFDAKAFPVEDKYFTITIPRVLEIRTKIDELNRELDRLQKELKNTCLF